MPALSVDGLLKHWDQQLAAMSPDERGELVEAIRKLRDGATATFSRLRIGTRYVPGMIGWLMQQRTMERTGPDFWKALEAKCQKAGEHVYAVFRAI